MLRLLEWLWFGCAHTYEDAGEVRTCTDDFGSRWFEQPMRCTKCGRGSTRKV